MERKKSQRKRGERECARERESARVQKRQNERERESARTRTRNREREYTWFSLKPMNSQGMVSNKSTQMLALHIHCKCRFSSKLTFEDVYRCLDV